MGLLFMYYIFMLMFFVFIFCVFIYFFSGYVYVYDFLYVGGVGIIVIVMASLLCKRRFMGVFIVIIIGVSFISSFWM